MAKRTQLKLEVGIRAEQLEKELKRIKKIKDENNTASGVLCSLIEKCRSGAIINDSKSKVVSFCSLKSNLEDKIEATEEELEAVKLLFAQFVSPEAQSEVYFQTSFQSIDTLFNLNCCSILEH